MMNDASTEGDFYENVLLARNDETQLRYKRAESLKSMLNEYCSDSSGWGESTDYEYISKDICDRIRRGGEPRDELMFNIDRKTVTQVFEFSRNKMATLTKKRNASCVESLPTKTRRRATGKESSALVETEERREEDEETNDEAECEKDKTKESTTSQVIDMPNLKHWTEYGENRGPCTNHYSNECFARLEMDKIPTHIIRRDGKQLHWYLSYVQLEANVSNDCLKKDAVTVRHYEGLNDECFVLVGPLYEGSDLCKSRHRRLWVVSKEGGSEQFMKKTMRKLFRAGQEYKYMKAYEKLYFMVGDCVKCFNAETAYKHLLNGEFTQEAVKKANDAAKFITFK